MHLNSEAIELIACVVDRTILRDELVNILMAGRDTVSGPTHLSQFALSDLSLDRRDLDICHLFPCPSPSRQEAPS